MRMNKVSFQQSRKDVEKLRRNFTARWKIMVDAIGKPKRNACLKSWVDVSVAIIPLSLISRELSTDGIV